MLIESTFSNDSQDDAPVDAKRIQAWQDELDQFLAATMTRLDLLVVAINECVEEPTPVPAVVETPTQESSRPTSRSIETVSQPVAEQESQPTVEPPAVAVETTPETPPTPSNETPVVDESPIPEDPPDPDEAMARLSAIKSRLAKQLGNN